MWGAVRALGASFEDEESIAQPTVQENQASRLTEPWTLKHGTVPEFPQFFMPKPWDTGLAGRCEGPGTCEQWAALVRMRFHFVGTLWKGTRRPSSCGSPLLALRHRLASLTLGMR